MPKNKLTIGIVILVLLLLIVGAFYVLRSKQDQTDVQTSNSAPPTGTNPGRPTTEQAASTQPAELVLSADILPLLLKFKNLKQTFKNDLKVFDDKVFASLQDKTVPLLDEPVGRDNPFLPLDSTSRNTATTTPRFIGRP